MSIGRTSTRLAALTLLASILGIGTGHALAAEGGGRTEVSVSGGVEALNQNDTALPDHFVNIPVVATVTHYIAGGLAAEGEFTWIIPVKQSIDLGTGLSQDAKAPDVLAYQANLRYDLPVARWRPYIVAGAGAMTFLSNTDPNRVPRLDQSQTAFAINFGAGVSYPLTERWAVRADVREFAAFPSDNASGLSDASGADAIWMERGTVGVAYAF